MPLVSHNRRSRIGIAGMILASGAIVSQRLCGVCLNDVCRLVRGETKSDARASSAPFVSALPTMGVTQPLDILAIIQQAIKERREQ